MGIFALGDDKPRLPSNDSYWIADSAVVIGKVEVGENVSIWHSASIRGDNDKIKIHSGSNVQENCVIHTDLGFPLEIGFNSTIGHGAILHGCMLAPRIIVGMGAIILNGAIIGQDCIVGAGALVAEGKEFLESGKLILGTPARVVRDLSDKEISKINETAAAYQRKIKVLKDRLRLVGNNQ